MITTIFPGRLKGCVTAPPSKSLTQRAIAAALLSGGTTVIKKPSFCQDSEAALKIAQRLGAEVIKSSSEIKVTGNKTISDNQILHCGESGLAMRMFAPLATLFTKKSTFTGEGSLLLRPVTMITDSLSMMGVTTETYDGLLPFTLEGHIKGGKYTIDGSSGSQLLTGLLLALPTVESDSELYVENLVSKPYIDLTIKLLSDFGVFVENRDFKEFFIPGRQRYKSCDYTIEGDWSGAAFLLVAGAIAGKAEVENLSAESKQADKAIIDVLKLTGADLKIKDDRIIVNRSVLKSFDFDATESPDLFPPLAALASYCDGKSLIKGVSRLTHKESNRTVTIMKVLEALGIKSSVEDDSLVIEGAETHGAAVSSHHDHRIAMMASVIALRCNGNVIITEADAVAKSYPEFYNDLKNLGTFIR